MTLYSVHSLSLDQGRREGTRRLPPPPYILNLLTRSSLIGSIIAEREKHARAAASLYLKVPAHDVKLLAFDAIEETANRGYEATHEAVADWWEGCAERID